ncbi:actin-like protein 8 [Suncus etruscus]|uniref:actin-like protein 8 n=1 Tax=Suncus etruscus TaxID=109475 RepID=UPI00210FAFCA|nr:actin-like protein 8 [Suncus etruscus]
MTEQTIVIDIGSGFLKAGWSGYNQPQMIQPSIVSFTANYEGPCSSKDRPRMHFGINEQNPDAISHPIHQGRINNWEAMEFLWSFILEKLTWNVAETRVLLAESTLRTAQERKKTLEIMFERLGVHSILLADELQLSLFGQGLLCGAVMDCGFGLTRVQCFSRGKPLVKTKQVMKWGDQNISTYLLEDLFTEMDRESQAAKLRKVSIIQMQACHVPEEFKSVEDMGPDSETGSNFQLPDGNFVTLGHNHRTAPEMFFNPHIFNLSGPSLPQAVLNSIKSCPMNLQPNLVSNLLVCGGASLYRGFTQRLNAMLVQEHFSKMYSKVALRANSTRNFSVWLGGSVLAHLSSYKHRWIKKVEYKERL